MEKKPIGSEEFLNRMVEALDIIIGRRPKGRPCKMESQTIEKIEYVPILIKKIEGNRKSDISRPDPIILAIILGIN